MDFNTQYNTALVARLTACTKESVKVCFDGGGFILLLGRPTSRRHGAFFPSAAQGVSVQRRTFPSLRLRHGTQGSCPTNCIPKSGGSRCWLCLPACWWRPGANRTSARRLRDRQAHKHVPSRIVIMYGRRPRLGFYAHLPIPWSAAAGQFQHHRLHA